MTDTEYNLDQITELTKHVHCPHADLALIKLN